MAPEWWAINPQTMAPEWWAINPQTMAPEWWAIVWLHQIPDSNGIRWNQTMAHHSDSNEGSALVDELITQTARRAVHWLMSSSLIQQGGRCICLCAHHSGGNEGGAFVYVLITQAATRVVYLFMCASLRRQRRRCICLCAQHWNSEKTWILELIIFSLYHWLLNKSNLHWKYHRFIMDLNAVWY